MRERDFHLRLDQSIEGNMRRLKTFMRNIDRNVKPVPKLKAKANLRALLRRVK